MNDFDPYLEIEMNEFDRYLETELRDLLDPVVDRRPPTRKGRSKKARVTPFLVVETLVPELVAVVEPVVVTIPVAPARSL